MLETLLVGVALWLGAFWLDAYAFSSLGCYRCHRQHLYLVLFQRHRAIICKDCGATIYGPGQLNR
jgi:hypothetical protein